MKKYFLICIATNFCISIANTEPTGDIYSLLYRSQAEQNENPKPPENGGVNGTIMGTPSAPQAYCSAGTCRAQDASGAVLTLTGITSLEEGKSKIQAFQNTNGGRYQITEWVSADGSVRWTPPPVAANSNTKSQQANSH